MKVKVLVLVIVLVVMSITTTGCGPRKWSKEVESMKFGEMKSIVTGGLGIVESVEFQSAKIHFCDGTMIDGWVKTPVPPIGPGHIIEVSEGKMGGFGYYVIK